MQAVGGVGGVGGVTAAVAAAVLVLGLVGLVTAAGKPLSPTISDYDEVHLDVNDMQHRHRRARQHTQQGPMQVEFSAFGKDYVLDMRMSHDMFGDGFTIERHTDEGVKLARMDMHIFFRGEVAGEEGSDVRATVTDGVFKGTIRTGGDILYLEPAHRFSRDIATSHVAYWASSVNLTSPHDHDHSKVCGVDSHSHDSEIEAILDRMRRADHKYMKQYQRRQRRGFQGDPTKTTCQMALVSDHRFFATTGESDAGTTAQRINTGSGAGGFCFTETQASFCGNGALEINEECDCGAACAEDPCCNENCELINGAQCSENSGPCCSNCQLVGIDMGVTPNPGDITSDIVCAEEQDCYTQRYCIKDPTLLGQCPEVHYPYHNDTDPPNCRGDASVSQCEVILDANNDYTFHKPLGTTCNEGSNICVLEGCAGSLCSQYQSTDVAGQMPSPGFNTSAYTPIQCALTGAKACHVACEFQQGVCNSTIDYATTPHGMNITKNGVPNSEVEPALRASGRSCNNFQGVCTPDGTCFESSAATPLDIFLSGSTLDWIISHWYITWAVLVGITLGAFIMRAYSRKQGGRIVIKEKDTDERKSLWQTLARRSKRGGHVKRDRQKNKVVVELQRQTDTAPNEALYRLKTLFPAAPDHVMQTVIKCSPHEEAAVFRLLHLGYAMRKLDDYKFLAFAGKKFRQDMRRHRLQQIQAQESTPHQQVQKPRRVVGFAPNNNQQGRALQARQGQRVVGVNTPKQQQQRQPQQQQQQRRARGKR
ncbi:hypothetical protein PTSG_10317 [Salpingoeca rosetta]|uniref:Disintegrin domain-containing protein n=1 Tax=Salpingoeca rosetta (strain ATCC 50818 / BSB-021) TaxID=946362 RepID=F2UQY8_SALR5|nr:uncharacterized protein PTSG_10317 [Salpingoeca rosetta]EGD80043.1 hypothetical protein PTSG_10317 [Salpingoeca rosetta]|eukprot:XP_004988368.1 hypothetical protein PTSG_10317 [Salpingoeca rosetta]